MSLMSTIATPIDRPVIATLLGDAGVGKTSLACSFPTPIFIRAEDGLQSIPIDLRPEAFPVIKNDEDLWGQLKALIHEKHEYKTLVIDSVTALERFFIQSVIYSDSKKPRSINQALGGYGAGLSAVASLHQRVRKACGILNENGMNIVFIAHADTETLELPDSEPYTRYTLRLGKRSQAPYTDDSDLVGFVRLRTYYTGDGERKKALSDGAREVVCYASASSVSKNRFGITAPLPVNLNENPFVKLLPFMEK